MSSIKALVNNANNAVIKDVPYPTLTADDYMIVKGTACAVNPADYKLLTLPGAIGTEGSHIGYDYAGVVVEVGPAVTRDFKKGDRVAGTATGQNNHYKTHGAFAEYFAVRGDSQLKIPDNVSDEDAASQNVAQATIAQSLYRDLELPWPNKPAKEPFNIFIYGGSAAMGLTGVQLAKLSGGTVITTASPSNADYLRSLGADYVLDYKSPTLVEDFQKLGLGPIKYALDCRPTEASATIGAKLLTTDGSAKFAMLSSRLDAVVESANPNVKIFHALANTSNGESISLVGMDIPASKEDYDLQKKFVLVAEKLIAEGKLKAPRVFLNRGGKGLEGLIHGIEEAGTDKVSGGKLVYTL